MVKNEVVATSTNDKGGRGLNIVAVDPFTHKVILAKTYDTYGSAEASG
jgi:hypothetical protein